MRFSIRDLLWLTAIVALAATLYTDRLFFARRTRQWADDRGKTEQETTIALTRLQSKISALRTELVLRERRFDVQLEDERRQHARVAYRLRAQAAAANWQLRQAASRSVALEMSAGELNTEARE